MIHQNQCIVQPREVHWVQGEDRKMREAFIKEYPGKLKDEKRGRKQ